MHDEKYYANKYHCCHAVRINAAWMRHCSLVLLWNENSLIFKCRRYKMDLIIIIIIYGNPKLLVSTCFAYTVDPKSLRPLVEFLYIFNKYI